MRTVEAVESWWETLVEERTGLHLSLFVPMARGGIAAHANLNRWRQGLRLAEARLQEAGASGETRADLLAPAHAWARVEKAFPESSDGLAYYAAPGFSRFVSTPFPLTEAVAVGARFRLRPLLPLARATEHFYVLALSLNDLRLLEGSPYSVRRIELPEMARSFAAASGYVYESERQVHSASPAALGERGAIVHGQGGNADDRRERDLEHHFRRLWEKITGCLPDRNAPIVLAAVEQYLPLVAAALRDDRLLDRCVGGSPDHLADEELWRRALPVATEWRFSELARRLRNSVSGGRPRLVSGLAEVLPAAEAGRVAHLFLAEHMERWGRYHDRTGRLEERALPAPGDEDLLERALLATLSHGGEVESLAGDRMPAGEPAAAWLRF